MLWTDFYDNFWDWSDSTRRSRISSLEDVGSGSEIVDVIYEIEDPKIRAQMIRKAIKLGAQFSSDDFQNLQDELSDDVYRELGQYAGFDADNPTYDQADTSWSHFYDNFTEWSPEVQSAALKRLTQLGKRDEVVDAILLLDGMDERVLLVQKAISAKVKFKHEDFENLQDELPIEVYRELATYTGNSADCPDYDRSNHTWKYFYENCCGWTEEIQLAAIAGLKTIGSQKQITEAILELEADAPKSALIERAIARNIIFSKDSLQELDGNLPDDLFQKLLQISDIPEDDLYFDEANMSWDDFECGYADWSEDLILQRIRKLKDFGDAEAVCDVILSMPTSELEDALYQKAKQKGVRFTEEQLESLGQIENQTSLMQSSITHDNQLEPQFDEIAQTEQNRANAKSILKVLGIIAAAIFGFFYLILHIIISLTKPYSDGNHHRTTHGNFGRHSHKKKSNHCDGDCDNCPSHYGYRYGRWYYGHGHQWGCQRGGNGGATGRTYRD